MIQNIGERTVKTCAVLAVIIMNVTKWTEPAPVNPHGRDRDGKERDVINVYKDTGDLIVSRLVVINVVFMELKKLHALKIKGTVITV